jgi:uncharacterized protein (DUF983 family)
MSHSFVTILRRRCPRCGQGHIFSGWFSMNERCPVCGLEFERETGYFLGAMYISYAITIPLLALGTLVGYLIRPGWSLWQLVLAALVASVPLVPWIFQYSRVAWIHFDRWIDPES